MTIATGTSREIGDIVSFRIAGISNLVHGQINDKIYVFWSEVSKREVKALERFVNIAGRPIIGSSYNFIAGSFGGKENNGKLLRIILKIIDSQGNLHEIPDEKAYSLAVSTR